MTLSHETITFFIFIVTGMLFSIIFDVFRAIRKVKKVKNKTICIQDILYFIIIGTILVCIMINYMDSEFRIHLIFAIILGIILYMSIIGNFVLNIFVKILNMGKSIIEFIFLPITLYIEPLNKQTNIIQKNIIYDKFKMY